MCLGGNNKTLYFFLDDSLIIQRSNTSNLINGLIDDLRNQSVEINIDQMNALERFRWKKCHNVPRAWNTRICRYRLIIMVFKKSSACVPFIFELIYGKSAVLFPDRWTLILHLCDIIISIQLADINILLCKNYAVKWVARVCQKYFVRFSWRYLSLS